MSFAVIAITGVSIAAVGAGLSAYGAISAGQSQKQAADYNAKVEKNNAFAANQQAKFDANQISDRTRRNVANQRAAMAASGFDDNTGSFIDVTSDTKHQGELDRLSRIYEGRLGVNRAMSQSQLDTFSGNAAVNASYFGAASGVLAGAGQATSIAGQYANYSSNNPSFGG